MGSKGSERRISGSTEISFLHGAHTQIYWLQRSQLRREISRDQIADIYLVRLRDRLSKNSEDSDDTRHYSLTAEVNKFCIGTREKTSHAVSNEAGQDYLKNGRAAALCLVHRPKDIRHHLLLRPSPSPGVSPV